MDNFDIVADKWDHISAYNQIKIYLMVMQSAGKTNAIQCGLAIGEIVNRKIKRNFTPTVIMSLLVSGVIICAALSLRQNWAAVLVVGIITGILIGFSLSNLR